MSTEDELRRLRACKLDKPDNTPTDGDFLRWDSTTQRPIWETVNISQIAFSAYDHGGAISVTTTAGDLDFDTEVKKDNGYNHTVSVAGVTIATAGFYDVQADVALAVSAGSTVSYVTVWLDIDGVEVEGSRAYIDVSVNGRRQSCTISRLIEVAAGDVLKVRAQLNTAGNTVATVADGCRLTIKQNEDTTSAAFDYMLDFSQEENSMYIGLF